MAGIEGDRTFIPALSERFGALAGWSYDHRWLVVLIFLAVLAGSAYLASRTRVNNGYEAYFSPSDPTFIAYQTYREDFGSDEVSYVLYDAPDFEHGPWNLEVMRKIADLTVALEDEVPFVYQVRSLVNAELIEGVADGIEIEKLGDAFPETQEELLAARDRVLAKPMLVGGLVSEDASHGALIVEMDRTSSDPLEEIRLDPDGGDGLDNVYPGPPNDTIDAILARPEYAGIRFYNGGDVPMNTAYNRVTMDESIELGGITMLVIGVILLLAFRTLTGALAPIAVVQLSIVATVAFIGLLGWHLDMGFAQTPTMLTAIGVAHSVHILSEFRGRVAARGERRAALVESVAVVGVPCLMTSVTTAIGFAAMSFVPIKAVAHTGIFTAFGVLASFALSLTLLMALLAMGRRELAGIAAVLSAAVAAFLLFPYGALPAAGGAAGVALLAGWLTLKFSSRERPRRAASRRSPRVDAMLTAIADFDIQYRRAIIGGFAALFALCAVGMTQITADTNWLDDFSYDMPIRAITERLDAVMGGSTSVIYLFDSGTPDGIKEPAVLQEMERLQEIAASHAPFVRKSYSLVDILKDLNQAFHGGDPEYYRLPESRELIAQYLLLYESSGGEDAEEYVTSDYQRASVEVRLQLAPSSWTTELVQRIDAELQDEPLEQATVTMTGIGALWDKLVDYIYISQIQGFALAFGAIALILISLFRSLPTGMIAMVPNLTPVVLVLALIGAFDLNLDIPKVMIAAVAIGIAVDDTIHMITRYRHEFGECGNYAEALQRAMRGVGRALSITSLALVFGFLVLTLSLLDSQVLIGILLATTIVSALVADFLLMPALIMTFHPFGPERARVEERLSDAA